MLRKYLVQPEMLGPGGSSALGITGALALCFGLALILLSQLPEMRTATEDMIVQHHGAFSYSSQVLPSPAYPDGQLRLGQPIFLNEVKAIDFTFDYEFKSDRPHEVSGEIEVSSLIRNDTTGWSTVTSMFPLTQFSGDKMQAAWTWDVSNMASFFQALEDTTGTTSPVYRAEISVAMHINGAVAGVPFTHTFHPNLPGSVQPPYLIHIIQPVRPQIETDDGVFHTTPPTTETLGDYLSSATRPTDANILKRPYLEPNNVKLLGGAFARSTLQTLSAVGVVLSLLSYFAMLGLSYMAATRSDAISILMAKHGSRILTVEDIGSVPNEAIVKVADFDDLLQIAVPINTHVLHVPKGDWELFAVRDGIMLYVYEMPHAGRQMRRGERKLVVERR